MKFNSNKNNKSPYDLIAIGCSAGGLEALKQILPDLPAGFSQTLVIIQHRGFDSTPILLNYLAQLCSLPLKEPEDKEPLLPGTVYIAPANYHLLVGDDRTFNLSVDEPVNHSRPSVDVFFQSAAQVYENRLLGVILSGANSDGAEGLRAVRSKGGMAVVQNPDTAAHRQMPQAAIAAAMPQSILTINEIRNYFCGL